MLDYLSIILYFIFFGGFIYFDFHQNKKKAISIFVTCLYVFLCFGYMTGSDWRDYEAAFDIGQIQYVNSAMDMGFLYVFFFLKRILVDYFLVIGFLKVLYLWSLIRLLKVFTYHWLLALGLCFAGGSLLYMIIDCPLRFMAANIFINIAIPFLFEKKIMKFILWSLPACFFHITCVIMIPLLLLSIIKLPFATFNKIALYVLFLIFSFLFSSVDYVSDIFSRASIIMQFFGERSFSGYAVQSNASFFSIGSLLLMFFAGVLIYYRDAILVVRKGRFIFDCAILYLFFSRITLLVPTGFRLVIPLGLFYFISFASIVYLKRYKFLRYGYILIISVTMFRNLYNGYSYIPYSNSVYYIVVGHKPYGERANYNLNAYEKRIGKQWEYDN